MSIRDILDYERIMLPNIVFIYAPEYFKQNKYYTFKIT